jgi:triosephosphate isomerase
MRKTLMAGNWKMNKIEFEARDFVRRLLDILKAEENVEVVLCPPYTLLPAVRHAVKGTFIKLGAQDVFWGERGAYTGKVSARMLTDLDVTYVIVGHSEARGRFGVEDPELAADLMSVFGDSDATVNKKVHACLSNELRPIVCVGETLPEREAGRTDAIVCEQARRALAGVKPEAIGEVTFAYEPVWAIGTGKVCGPEEANRVCEMIRDVVDAAYGRQPAEMLRVLYGGSVKPDNIGGLMEEPHIDGGLVGGASLEPDTFAELVRFHLQ